MFTSLLSPRMRTQSGLTCAYYNKKNLLYKSRYLRWKLRTQISMPFLCVSNVYTSGPISLVAYYCLCYYTNLLSRTNCVTALTSAVYHGGICPWTLVKYILTSLLTGPHFSCYLKPFIFSLVFVSCIGLFLSWHYL